MAGMFNKARRSLIFGASAIAGLLAKSSPGATMPSLMPTAKQQFFYPGTSLPLVGGKLYTYAASTSTPQPTYQDAAGTVPNANPITLDATGSALIYWSGSYKIVLKDALGNLVYTVDNYSTDLTAALQAQLAKADGASQVGYGTDTVKGALDALQLPDYTALRAYNGKQSSAYVTGYLATARPSGIAGMFVRDDTDTTTADDGAMCIVTTGGKRYKRVFDGLFVDPEWFGADPSGAADSAGAIQLACNWASSNGRLTVRLAAGSFKLSTTIKTTDINAPVGTVACGLIGAGEFSTRLLPSGDFTVVKFVASYLELGGFSIEWPLTAKALIPNTRIGVEFCDGNSQVAYARIRNITVQYPWRSFVMNDWTGSTYGSMYLTVMEKLTSFRAADWGFYLNSKVGSTTLRMIQCYVRGDDSTGAANGKGFYATNFNDLYIEQPTIDLCVDSWMSLTNYNTCLIIGMAWESNTMVSAGATAVLLQGTQTRLSGIKDISCTYNTGGTARVIFAGAQCQLDIDDYNEQYSTVTAGTTKYRVAFNAAGTDVSVLDRSILPAHILDNGYYHSVVYQGVRRSRTGLAPSYGNWIQGDYIKNGAPAVGQPKGWYCTVAGGPGTWVSEGVL